MKKAKREFIHDGKKCQMKSGDILEEEDLVLIEEAYNILKRLNEISLKLSCRKINVPEVVSEGLTCMLFDWYRTNGSGSLYGVSGSGDALNIKDDGIGEIIQIKSYTKRKGGAGPTSFGPRSQYDKLIALEVDLDTDLFSYYDLSDIDISSINVSKTETVEDQSNSGKRSRFSIDTEIINKFGLKPFAIYNIKKEEFIYRDKSY